jgi:SAM-dependent methyltransferase
VSFEEKRATSFGRVAGSYDQVRPGPAAAAVDWLLPAGCAVAVDLAAGTGLFTRALEGRVAHVVAVEPDGRMREVLAARSPGVRVLDGQAEAIPLPDGYADAVFVSTAWHWFDPARAVREQLARHHQVTVPPDAELGPAQTASFGFTRTLTVSDTLDWLATSSRFITAAEADREAALDRLRISLTARSDGKELIQMPLRSWCWRADRLHREAP